MGDADSFRIIVGATKPDFEAGPLRDARGAVVDLTTATTMTLTIASRTKTPAASATLTKTLVLNGAATLGKVKCAWTTADTTKPPGQYVATIKIVFADGTVRKFGAGGFGWMGFEFVEETVAVG